MLIVWCCREWVQYVIAWRMQEHQLLDVIREVSSDRPFLGICVGMQALLDSSEENGGVDCLGLFPGRVRAFGADLYEGEQRLKVPHMGWNTVAMLAASVVA